MKAMYLSTTDDIYLCPEQSLGTLRLPGSRAWVGMPGLGRRLSTYRHSNWSNKWRCLVHSRNSNEFEILCSESAMIGFRWVNFHSDRLYVGEPTSVTITLRMLPVLWIFGRSYAHAIEVPFGENVRTVGAGRVSSRTSLPKVFWIALLCLGVGSVVTMAYVLASESYWRAFSL